MGKRKDDETGPSTWEKIHMGLSSAKILYSLLIALGAASAYGNSETVRNTVHRVIGSDDIPVASGEVVSPVTNEQDAWRAQVQQSLTSIISKLEKHEQIINKVEAGSEQDDDSLQSQINSLRELVE